MNSCTIRIGKWCCKVLLHRKCINGNCCVPLHFKTEIILIRQKFQMAFLTSSNYVKVIILALFSVKLREWEGTREDV